MVWYRKEVMVGIARANAFEAMLSGEILVS